MDAEAAKLLGAGIAALGMGLAGIGVGAVAAGYLQGALRNPSAASGLQGMFFVGVALAEALGIFAFVIAILLITG